MSKPSVRARVQLVVEFAVPDAWGTDCSFDQVRKQAIDAAHDILRRGMAVNGLVGYKTGYLPDSSEKRVLVEANLVGEPKVTAVLVDL
jgi:hypothetical protein